MKRPLHERIVAARTMAGLSQSRLAELANVPRNRLRELEGGGNVTLDTLQKVIAQLPSLAAEDLVAMLTPASMARMRSELETIAVATHRALSLLADAEAVPADARVEPRTADDRAFAHWLAVHSESAREPAAEMLELPVTQWKRWLAEEPAAQTAPLFFVLLDEVRAEIDRQPDRALALAELITLWVDTLDLVQYTDAPEVARPLLRGRASTAYGHALLETVGPQAALHAFEHAVEVFSGPPPLVIERLVAARGIAVARHLLGQSENALRILAEGIAVFAAHRDPRNEMLSRLEEGAILVDTGEPRAAEALLQDALRSAEDVQDVLSMARIHSILGHCAYARHDPQAALGFTARALMLFDEHGLWTHVPQTLSSLADLLADADSLDESRARMEAVGRVFLDAGRALPAARAQLQIVEMLAMRDGDADKAAALACDLLRTFEGTGMAHQAMRALEYVAHKAEERTLTSQHARNVADFFRRLQGDPHALFVA